MDEHMFKRFNNLNIWKHYVNYNSLECRLALIITILLIIFLNNFLNVYSNFQNFSTLFSNMSLGIGQALIGMLGVMLTGLALVINLLNNKIKRKIEQVNGHHVLEEILISFVFLAFNIAIGIFIFYIIPIILAVPLPLVSKFIFIIVFFLVTYHLSFIIFYTLILIYETVDLFFITDDYLKLDEMEGKSLERINEVRIDYLLQKSYEDKGLTKEEFLEEIEGIINNSTNSKGEKLEIINYLNNYYR